MNLKCSVYIAASVDGFIAKSDGDIEWLHRPEYAGSSINGLTYDEFIYNVDVLIMGHVIPLIKGFNRNWKTN